MRVALVLLLSCVYSVRAEESPAFQRLKAIAEEMAKFGMPVDMGKVRLAVREPRPGGERVESPYGRRTETGDGASGFLSDAWGLSSTEQTTIEAWAYYIPSDRRVVFHAIGTGALNGGDAIVAHELTHALQHQRHSRWFDPPWTSTEVRNIRSCLSEGEASLAELLLLLHRRGKTLVDAHLPAIDAARRGGIDVGGGSAPYIAGFRFAAEQYLGHGATRMTEWQKRRPTSTEQILHPSKIGADLPTVITFPSLPKSKILRKDVLGELELFRIWSAQGNVSKAMRASIGWDGDELRVYRTTGGTVFTVWVSAWDRLADAAQAWSAVKTRWKGNVIRNGRTVIWYRVPNAAIRRIVQAACAAHSVTSSFDKRAAESTEKIEKRWDRSFRRGRRAVDGRWWLGDVPVSLPLPSDWAVNVWSGGTVLTSRIENNRFISVRATTWPLAAFGDLDGVEKFVRRAAHSLYWMRVRKVERIEAGGVSALLVERTAMWGKRVLQGSFRELYIPVGGTLVRYFVHLAPGTPKALIRDAESALRGFRVGPAQRDEVD